MSWSRRIFMMQVRAGWIGALVWALASCADDREHSAPTQVSSDLVASPMVRQVRTIADEMRELAAAVPAFAGVFVDSSGVLTINATVPVLAAGDLAKVVAFAQRQGTTARLDAPVIRTVEFGYLALDAYYRPLVNALGAERYVTATRIDDFTAKIVISVDELGRYPDVRRIATHVGVPPAMLEMQVLPPVENLVTLQQYVRPVYGGLRIHTSAVGSCTLGFNGFALDPNGYPDPSQPVFMTAAHCAAVYGQVTGTRWTQGNNLIGEEIHQAPVLYGYPSCPLFWSSCTYADVVVARYYENVEQGYGAVYYTNPGTITIAGTYAVNGPLYGAVAGEKVYKTGQTTGTTSGTLNGTCVNVPPRTDGTPGVLCSHEVLWMASDSGDSGAPVFIPYTPSAPNVTPRTVGILFGRTGGLIRRAYYSPIGNIWSAQANQFYW